MANEQQRVNRGKRFEGVREPLDDLFQGVRAHLLEMIEEAAPGDPNVLEMHRGLQNLLKLRTALRRVIDDGLTAEAALRQEQLHRA
jgi:signal transduction protein with GAF and PtsI domain